LSARLRASLQTNGDCNLFLFGIPAGHLKGKKADIVVLQGAQGWSGNGPADLSKTAGAEAKAEA
jgi:hypothetical protein